MNADEIEARFLAMEAIVKATVLAAYGKRQGEHYMTFVKALNGHIERTVSTYPMKPHLVEKAEGHARRLLEEVFEELDWFDEDGPKVG